jgi:hypothetical protein
MAHVVSVFEHPGGFGEHVGSIDLDQCDLLSEAMELDPNCARGAPLIERLFRTKHGRFFRNEIVIMEATKALGVKHLTRAQKKEFLPILMEAKVGTKDFNSLRFHVPLAVREFTCPVNEKYVTEWFQGRAEYAPEDLRPLLAKYDLTESRATGAFACPIGGEVPPATRVLASDAGTASKSVRAMGTDTNTPTSEMFRAYVAAQNYGITQKEIAKELKVRQGTVSKYVSKVRQWLDAGNKLPGLDAPEPEKRPKTVSVDPAKMARWTESEDEDAYEFDEE